MKLKRSYNLLGVGLNKEEGVKVKLCSPENGLWYHMKRNFNQRIDLKYGKRKDFFLRY